MFQTGTAEWAGLQVQPCRSLLELHLIPGPCTAHLTALFVSFTKGEADYSVGQYVYCLIIYCRRAFQFRLSRSLQDLCFLSKEAGVISKMGAPWGLGSVQGVEGIVKPFLTWIPSALFWTVLHQHYSEQFYVYCWRHSSWPLIMGHPGMCDKGDAFQLTGTWFP